MANNNCPGNAGHFRRLCLTCPVLRWLGENLDLSGALSVRFSPTSLSVPCCCHPGVGQALLQQPLVLTHILVKFSASLLSSSFPKPQPLISTTFWASCVPPFPLTSDPVLLALLLFISYLCPSCRSTCPLVSGYIVGDDVDSHLAFPTNHSFTPMEEATLRG